MYNRYIPQPDGTYRRSRVTDPGTRSQPQNEERPCREPEPEFCPPPPPPPCREQEPERKQTPPSRQNTGAADFLRQLLPRDLDTGDLLIILLLLLMAGDCREDRNNALLTLVLYLLM